MLSRLMSIIYRSSGAKRPIRFNTPDGHKKLLHIAEEVHKHMLDKFGVAAGAHYL